KCKNCPPDCRPTASARSQEARSMPINRGASATAPAMGAAAALAPVHRQAGHSQEETNMRSTIAGKYLSKLYVQVLIAIAAGILLGHYMPDLGAQAKPLGDLFIKMIKMLLAPIIFASIVVGVARMNNVH